MYIEENTTYQLLRKARLGKLPIPSNLQPLADWIKKRYGVTPLWFTEDSINSGESPRLNVIFEWKKDEKLFYNVSGNGGINQR